MLLPVVLLVIGLGAPFALRRAAPAASWPRLVVAAELAGLVLAWVGLVGSVSALAAPAVSLLELCRLIAMQPLTAVGPLSTPVLLLVVALMPGRAIVSATRSVRGGRALRRQLPLNGVDGSATVDAPLGTVACTVGVLRPRVVVDPELLGRLSTAQQRAVLAHERAHARGFHGFIDVVVRALAAGLAPWPGAHAAVVEVRRHLEAIADDRAARHSGRRVVASAIVAAACGPMPPVGTLGAAGWAMWRVDRLLSEAAPRPWAVSLLGALIALTGLVIGQVTVHAFHALSNWHAIPVLATCCVV